MEVYFYRQCPIRLLPITGLALEERDLSVRLTAPFRLLIEGTIAYRMGTGVSFPGDKAAGA
jgi:hypothetical protein